VTSDMKPTLGNNRFFQWSPLTTWTA